MTLAFRVVTTTIKGLTRIMCRIDAESLARVPDKGPLILVANHINFLDAPVMYTHLQPRHMTGFAKSETWDNPLLGPLFDLWGVIPIQRGEADRSALRAGLNALEKGCILAITPEGTRSGDGRLAQGHPGMVQDELAAHDHEALDVHLKAPTGPPTPPESGDVVTPEAFGGVGVGVDAEPQPLDPHP